MTDKCSGVQVACCALECSGVHVLVLYCVVCPTACCWLLHEMCPTTQHDEL